VFEMVVEEHQMMLSKKYFSKSLFYETQYKKFTRI
jgi:hypothetical protein